MKKMTGLDAAIALCAVCVAIAFALWAGAIVLLQGFGWLQHAEWQPVPAGVLFLTGQEQSAHLKRYPGTNPVDIVPAFGDGRPSEPSRMKGVEKLRDWFSELPLVLYMLVVAIAFLVFAAYLEASS